MWELDVAEEPEVALFGVSGLFRIEGRSANVFPDLPGPYPARFQTQAVVRGDI